MRNRHKYYMWVSGAINIKDYTKTVTLAITVHRLSVVRIMMSDTFGKVRKAVAFTSHYITVFKISK